MSVQQLTFSDRAVVRALFTNTDAEVARAIGSDSLHRGTALFVLKQFALEVEKLDGEFGGELVARHTEAACMPAAYTAARTAVPV